METQNTNQSGHEGHNGVHICNKCGWPFPNPHPSAKHRRAHKRVCGTLEGYASSDYDHHDTNNSSDKFVERTISRKSSSGVGSRSTRSEDEVFADAVTDFGDNPDGVLSRGNSMQNTLENKDDDNLSASTTLLEDKELFVKAIEGENYVVESSQLSHDHITSSSNYTEDSGVEEHTEDVSSKVLTVQSIPCDETAKEASEDVCAMRNVSEESLDSVTVGGKEKVECSHDVDSENLQASMHSVQVVEPADDNAGKVTNMVEECDSTTIANENDYVLAVPDTLLLQENSDISVDDLDHKGGKFNISMASDATLDVESVEVGKTHVIEESRSISGFTKPGGSNYVCSVDDIPTTVHLMEDMLNPEVGENKSYVEQNTVGELVQISDVKASDADIVEYISKELLEDIKEERWKDQEKSIVSSNNISPKGATSVGGDDQEMTANEGANTTDDFKHDGEESVVDDNVSKVPADELTLTSPMSAESDVNDFVIHVEELSTDLDASNVGYDEKVKVEDTALNENEGMLGGEEVIEPVEAKIAPNCGLNLAEYSERNDEFFEPENNHDQGELDKNLVSGKVMDGHSQQESFVTSLGVRDLQTVEDNMGEVDTKTVDNTGAVGKPDDNIDSILKTIEDAGSSCPSSDVITERFVERAANNSTSLTEGDKITKQHVSALVVDIGDSYSQTDSLDGNWGSISVLSVVSDASPAIDMAASKNPQALAEEVTVSLEPKQGEEGHKHAENKTSGEPQPQPQVAAEELAGASEIQEPQSEQQQSSTGGTLTVADAENKQLGGTRDDDIISKVNDWNSGKQHTALKTLLGEASARSRAESPNHDVGSVSVPKIDEVPKTNNMLPSKTENMIISSVDPKAEATKEEIGKEWNSPARYPVNIKTEKKRAKSRPYWVPFLCCSSVNAR